MRDLRIIKRDLVYIIGLSEWIANEEVLRHIDYLGQYGIIRKIVVNKDKPFNRNSNEGPSYSAYVTFSTENEAALAILAIDGFEYDSRVIKASFGMTKYCSFFIKNISCPNDDCLYLHKIAKETDCFNKEEGNLAKNLLKNSREGTLQFLVNNNNEPFRLFSNKNIGSQFPSNKVVEKIVVTYCKTHNILYENKEEKINVKAVKCEKKAVGNTKTNITNVCKWDDDEFSVFNEKNEMENNTSKDLNLNKPTSVDQSKVRQTCGCVPSNQSNNKCNKITAGNKENSESIKDSPAKSLQNKFYNDPEPMLDFSPMKKISIENTFKEKSRKNSRIDVSLNKETGATKSLFDQENLSEEHSNDYELEINIEQILGQKSEEYSELDRQILYRLNSSYVKFAKTESRTQFTSDSVLVNIDSTELTKKCEDIKKMINTFLQPNTNILTAKNEEHAKENDDKQFKLFGQSYYIHIPKRDAD